MSGWELNELVQPRLKLAVWNQLIEGKQDSSMEGLQEDITPTGMGWGQRTAAFCGHFWTQNHLWGGSPLLSCSAILLFVAVGTMGTITTEGL